MYVLVCLHSLVVVLSMGGAVMVTAVVKVEKDRQKLFEVSESCTFMQEKLNYLIYYERPATI